LEIAVVSQGPTLDETIENLREAVALHLDGDDPAAFGLRENPTLLVTIEVQPSYVKAS
jgi:predicted RNase H-like HicB family nuclease